MILYPAIDLRNGRVVRLKEGDPNRQTIFSDDPLTTAKRWRDAGATWLHIVNLDGAFGQASKNLAIAEQIAQLDGIKIQFGGGLRQLQDVQTAINLGVSRVVLGTVALNHPEVVIDAVKEQGTEAICVGLDAKNGKITTHGWQTVSETTAITLGQQMKQAGVTHALYTDVSRDGLLTGVNVEETLTLAQQTHLSVIASGGVRHLDDIRTLAKTRRIAGVIIGMALYTEQFTLQEAFSVLESE